MNKFAVDFDLLDKKMKPQPKIYKLADVKDKIKKVSFDIVRFTDSDNLNELWQVKQTDEGDVIVAMYDTSDKPVEKTSSTNLWNVIADNSKENLNVIYKNKAIKKLAASKFNIDKNDVLWFCKTLSKKFANDETFIKSFIEDLSEQDKAELIKEFPELNC